MNLPEIISLDEFASYLGVNKRTLRERANSIGACVRIGHKTLFLPEHIQQILEASQPCHLSSTSAAKSGGTVAQLPEGDYASLQAQRTKQRPKGSQAKQKQKHGQVILMDQVQR